jgi:hypothetical protein
VAAVGCLELGIGSAVTAGVVNYFALRRARPAGIRPGPARPTSGTGRTGREPSNEHTIYVNPWAGDQASSPRPGAGPASLP